jgi:hypothetical protein
VSRHKEGQQEQKIVAAARAPDKRTRARMPGRAPAGIAENRQVNVCARACASSAAAGSRMKIEEIFGVASASLMSLRPGKVGGHLA